MHGASWTCWFTVITNSSAQTNIPMPKSDYSMAIIIPVMNEAARIERLLGHLNTLRSQVIIVDGGSEDETKNICENKEFRVVYSKPGRARQMNAGVHHISADCYWFLHADCSPPDRAVELIQQSLSKGFEWGRFDVSLSGDGLIYRVIERLMNWRSCLTQVATGDQGIFISRSAFLDVGGYPDIPLMEDIAISKLLRKRGRGACIHDKMQVSARRWQQTGVIRTIVLMWWLRWRYFIGADPVALHKAYYGG
jgi:rSAM/selenodomain-associated transferase 2